MEFFKIAENAELLMTVLNSWNGAPWEHMGETRSGIDCSKLLAEVYLEMGIICGKENDVYLQPDWMIQSREENLISIVNTTLNNYLKGNLYFDSLSVDSELMVGDLVFFSLLKNGVTHHAGIYAGDGKIFHCLTKRDCSFWKISNAWKKRITFIYRMMIKWQ